MAGAGAFVESERRAWKLGSEGEALEPKTATKPLQLVVAKGRSGTESLTMRVGREVLAGVLDVLEGRR